MDREQLDNWCEKSVLGLVLAILVFSVLAIGAARPQDFLVVPPHVLQRRQHVRQLPRDPRGS